MSNSRGVSSSGFLEAEGAGLRGRTAQPSHVEAKRAGTVSRVRFGKPGAALQSRETPRALGEEKTGTAHALSKRSLAGQLSGAAGERA